MLLRLALFLSARSGRLRRVLWRRWYTRLVRTCPHPQWTFMNYGFAATDGTYLRLDDADEPDRLCIQLYQRVATEARLAGANVLEIGSGRGGGASYLARCQGPMHVTGVDYSSDVVKWSRQRFSTVPNLCFLPGDAEKLPFPDGTFDTVLNVESSHCYGDIPKFLREAARVLRPGGFFAIADFREPAAMGPLLQALSYERSWELVVHDDITANISAALVADNERKEQLIRECVPPDLQPVFREFAGVEGSEIFRKLRQGDLVYHRFACRKRERA
jgi:ubiquinone/menaquinone biosynthesis C-methylase UbiE